MIRPSIVSAQHMSRIVHHSLLQPLTQAILFEAGHVPPKFWEVNYKFSLGGAGDHVIDHKIEDQQILSRDPPT